MKALQMKLLLVFEKNALSGVDSAVFNLSLQWKCKFLRFGEYLQTGVHL